MQSDTPSSTIVRPNKVQVIILSIFLVITILALIGFVIYHFVTRSKAKAETNVVAPTPVSMIGMAYRTDSKEVRAINNQMNKIIALSQQYACTMNTEQIRAEVLDEVFSNDNYASMTCAKAVADVKSSIASMTYVPQNISVEIEKLIQMLMDESCGSNGMIDRAKFKTLMDNFINALCTST